MTAITYTVLEDNPITGHLAGELIEFRLRGKNVVPQPKHIQDYFVADGGGLPMVDHQRTEWYYPWKTPPIPSGELATYLEFLASVDKGQPFTFDFSGSVGAPDNPVQAVLYKGYKQIPIRIRENIFAFSFTIWTSQ